MPQITKNAPDYIDLQNLLGVLGEEYKVVVYFSTRLRDDRVEVIGKTHGAPYTIDAPVQHVALASFYVKQPKDMAVTMYTLAFDLWCQHDGGGATAAKRGAPTGWNGRVEVPRGARRK
jgi:hypothetical protein